MTVISATDSAAVLTIPSPGAVRDELLGLLVTDIHGPVDVAGVAPSTEEIEDAPSERYVVGCLAPQQLAVDPAALDRLGDDEKDPAEEGAEDTVTPATAALFPSSMGLSFCVAESADALTVRVSWARYARVPSVSALRDDGSPRLVWRREPHGGEMPMPLVAGSVGPLVPDDGQPEVVVRGRVRPYDGGWLVSLFLVNGQVEPASLADQSWLFQASLTVTGSAGGVDGAPVFRRRPPVPLPAAADERSEARALAMAYRTVPEFAVGHGVGVHVEASPDPMAAVSVATSAMPRFEVPRTDPPTVADEPDLAGAVLDMAELSRVPDGGFAAALQPLVTAYAGWVQRQRARIGTPGAYLDDYAADAAEALARCEEAAGRITAGIAVLDADPMAAEAFRFANEAMWRQRVRTLAVARRRENPKMSAAEWAEAITAVDVPANRSWRPFQVAFVLMNLPSLADPAHEDRRAFPDGRADLLWFPTGGGKTEAYLGLTAFTLALRRLQGPLGGYDASEGVAVLMRYTLRLLTVQQFQRAAALIAACEVGRRERLAAGDGRWAGSPYRIGLWVGGRVTPNRFDDAEEWVKSQASPSARPMPGRGRPHQLTACPWCGTAIDPRRQITADAQRRRTVVGCADVTAQCPFTLGNAPGEGIPVVVVDEEIYRLLPALVIATVDKFAQMPWRGEVQALFGRVGARCGRHGFRVPDQAWESDSHPATPQAKGSLPAARTEPCGPLRPPDLIIQDELHLIAGPLGSLVGLYETAVDRLATWPLDTPGGPLEVRPKVVASTATVRRARQQVHRLFLRPVAVFPPPGLDAADSFFARQRGLDEAAGRLYVGVCAHGRRIKNVLIRTYASLLLASAHLHEKYGRTDVTDPYLTLVGYFNSLRELGGMRRLVDDDVATRIGKGGQLRLPPRMYREVAELTSRLSSDDIPTMLDRLGVAFTGRSVLSGKARRRGADAPDPRSLDVLLATNMVSVGVDVPRLGMMVVGGQPKGTSEYIQATSRVGRAAPGLVVTVLNWARPRDLSHYETFEHYHATFYRRVEALSVTPYADRAVDRGLTATLVSLVRLTQPPWSPNRAAQQVDRHGPLPAAAVAAVTSRAAEVGDPATAQRVAASLQARLDQWEAQQHQPAVQLAYDERPEKGGAVALLHRPGADPWGQWTCLMSLRDVEAPVALLLGADDIDLGTRPPAYEMPSPVGSDDSTDGDDTDAAEGVGA